MPSTSRVSALAAVVLVAATLGLATLATGTPASDAKPPRVAAPVPGVGIFRLGGSFTSAAAYKRYAYVVVGRANARKVARLSGTSLVYHSGMVSSAFDTGVPYSQALANGWLLRSSSGGFITARGYPTSFLADVGSSAYQQAWIANVLSFLRSTRVDGVFMDEVAADVGVWSGDVYPAKYLNQVDWENAMTSFVAAVGSALKSRGYYVLVSAGKFISGNVGSVNGSLTASFWQRLAPSVSGLFNEYWMQSPLDVTQLRAIGSEWWNNWDGWQRLVSVAQGAGADFVGFTYGSTSNLRNMRYAKASFLLDWHGRGGAFIYAPVDGGDPAAVLDLHVGRPLRPKIQLMPGVWRRRYERGVVVLNATSAPVRARVLGIVREIAAADALIVRG